MTRTQPRQVPTAQHTFSSGTKTMTLDMGNRNNRNKQHVHGAFHNSNSSVVTRKLHETSHVPAESQARHTLCPHNDSVTNFHHAPGRQHLT